MFDVVMAFHHRERFWDRVMGGFESNRSQINKVIVANTGGPSCLFRGIVPGVSIVVDVPKVREEDFNVSAAINRAVEHVTTDFFVLTDDDIVFAPQTLAVLADGIAPQQMQVGEAFEVPEDSNWEALQNIDLASRLVRRKEGPAHFYLGGIPRLIDTQAFRVLGGWNENMLAYGLQDHEFTLRWLKAFGYSSVKVKPSFAFHLGQQSSNERLRSHVWREANERYLEKALRELEQFRGPFKVKVTT